ncbi:MAG TPA: ATP-binding protein, partial [Verrucomicrobiae bacterium]|nr:ATP-binding protein [Verrucomicrobiae bacterium]
VDRSGRERVVIRDGKVLPPEMLRDVSRPENTEFLSEDYFARTRALPRGKIHVSRVTGFHVTKQEQLAGAPDPESAVGGAMFHGVVRFATPLFDRSGSFDGIMVISLDHRHLMEFSQHIQPMSKTPVVFPSYKSGNYAFIFDDEGWIITHPKFWDIRGLDRRGKPVPPYNARSTQEEIDRGLIPFNLDHAGFVHRNYPEVARQVRERQSGCLDVTNVGGARKVMAFAPIPYTTGDYATHGIFGAVTIGCQTDRFHEMAAAGAGLIDTTMRDHLKESAVLVALIVLLVVPTALFISRGITRPLQLFTEGAQRVAGGDTSFRVVVQSDDELGMLAEVFNRMSRQLETRRKRLVRMFVALRSSRNEILNERNFKESILESISSGIFTFSSDGLLTSINGTGRNFLGERARPGTHYSELFTDWADLSDRITMVLEGKKAYGREPLEVNRGGVRNFEIGFFPIRAATRSALTVTLRDETEKQRMREEITRMDRLASLGKLSAGIAHEIRNPLTGISLLLDDLHDHAADPDSRAMMRRALSEIERMERLIAALLNYASPPRAEFRTADLNRTIQDTLLLLKRECEKKGVLLEWLPGPLPPVSFDSEKIKQALLNVVKNALEAMHDRGRIEVATSAEAGWVTVRVADNGPGIHPDDLPFLFEPFFTRKGAGTGLGLSITQRVIEEHQGELAVTSTPGAGAVFTIRLPLLPAPASAPTDH